ncbi:MAG: four helix bundle protein [Gallionella sp.]|nr:four helix bundle protein [Gallionella sp.]
MPGYRDLKVWQSAMLLAEEAYRLGRSFPKHEVYGLTSQLQRSAVSIPSNIAEGQGRNSPNEFRHFLGNALGSLAELETQILLAQRFDYISQQQSSKALQLADEIGKMLKGLQKSLGTD